MNSGIVGISPGNIPVHHASGLKVVDGRLKVAEIVLRFVVCGLGALAAVLVGSDTEDKVIFSVDRKAKVSDMKSLVFMVVANGIAASYSLIQVLRCVSSMLRGNVLFSKPFAWAMFSCDQVMAYLTLAAVTAATQSAELAEVGQPELQWMKICNLYEKFCTQVGEGIACSFVVTLSMVIISCISAFNLFRLYGRSKGKGNGKW